MSLTPKDVSRIARLARLELSEAAQAKALNELNSMLGLIEALQSVDTSGVIPLAHPLSVHEEISLRLREDVVTETASIENRQSLMANAPAESEGLFLVPKVIE
ncbi:Asp-tRNA(Asn)/Glu-tRNA(Gln) amidotransferase subunit GatC [Pelistega europaea]|uniref:Aspartyl/glutamyl-tRNA(Asn/Gln) amidotransferase subunit C n=1 Tax=Pelistega europaea TaxID=106147 RepID=A0A7Y4P4B4_9BURK|nr:Asp-tRNA(Asn)/Glu-tRNA(Gln) amidotransferase subunit GatC [Pelistega europaea]NOL49321.1 Asp-tRNA(Asn)/Glu-tRNA(Gln) amidotransferase subunit GatC [Pelistega europaea]